MHIEGKIVNCEPDVLLKVCLRQVVSFWRIGKGLAGLEGNAYFCAHILKDTIYYVFSHTFFRS